MSLRGLEELRPISVKRKFTTTAAGSVLWQQGQTIILATASLSRDLPPWFGTRQVGGWVTAEYTMLPGSTPSRKPWPKTGHTDSRGTEIQRLIGRAIRASIDLSKLGPHSLHIDCHVLQADGGTRTAAICAGFLAMRDAVATLPDALTPRDPSQPTETEKAYEKSKIILDPVAAVSVGIIEGQAHLDLDYALDVRAQVDLNLAYTRAGRYVEIQAAAENGLGYTHEQLLSMLEVGRRGCAALHAILDTHVGPIV